MHVDQLTTAAVIPKDRQGAAEAAYASRRGDLPSDFHFTRRKYLFFDCLLLGGRSFYFVSKARQFGLGGRLDVVLRCKRERNRKTRIEFCHALACHEDPPGSPRRPWLCRTPS
eukprot:scaffold237666_cov33-Tisochrysis_lutea.AAC.2